MGRIGRMIGNGRCLRSTFSRLLIIIRMQLGVCHQNVCENASMKLLCIYFPSPYQNAPVGYRPWKTQILEYSPQNLVVKLCSNVNCELIVCNLSNKDICEKKNTSMLPSQS